MIHVFITEKGRAYALGKQEEFLEHSAAMLEKLGEEDTQHYAHYEAPFRNLGRGAAKPVISFIV